MDANGPICPMDSDYDKPIRPMDCNEPVSSRETHDGKRTDDNQTTDCNTTSTNYRLDVDSTEALNTTVAADPDHPTDYGFEATKFQLRILCILAEEARYGLAVKRALEDVYGEGINHGRLYPNLDTLAEAGFVAKSEIDERTNSYELTESGRQYLESEVGWLAQRLWGGEA